MSATIVMATTNKGKLRELKALFQANPESPLILGLDSFFDLKLGPETGTSFLANALEKARYTAAATGLVAIADDSGLVVDALDGRPGVYSARYSGPGATDAENNARVLDELKGIPPEQRSACFYCSLAAVAPNGVEVSAQGSWPGRIAFAPAGEGGFGYDPIFYDPELGLTNAQLSAEEKNKRSHRNMALKRLIGIWPDFWARAGQV